MSTFIRSMPSAGLIEMPPVSNVMPLPTRPSTGWAAHPAGCARGRSRAAARRCPARRRAAIPCRAHGSPLRRARSPTASCRRRRLRRAAPARAASARWTARCRAHAPGSCTRPARVPGGPQARARLARASLGRRTIRLTRRACGRSAGVLLRCPVSCCARTTPSATACTRRAASTPSDGGTTIAKSVIRRWRATSAAADARRRATSGDQRSRGPAPRPEHARGAPPVGDWRPPLLERRARHLACRGGAREARRPMASATSLTPPGGSGPSKNGRTRSSASTAAGPPAR